MKSISLALSALLFTSSVFAAGTANRKPAAVQQCGYVNGVSSIFQSDATKASITVDFKADKANPHAQYTIAPSDQAGVIGQMIVSAAFSQKHICIDADDNLVITAVLVNSN